MRLYEIADEFLEIRNQLENYELDEITIENTLDGMAIDFENKARSIAAIIMNMEAETEAIETAIQKMKDKLNKRNKEINWLKYYLKTHMKRTGINNISSNNHEFKIRLYPERDPMIVIDDIGIIPKEYLRSIPEYYEADKRLIKEAFDQGVIVSGVRMVKRDRLEIR